MNRRRRKLPIRRDGKSQIEPERVEAADQDESEIVGGDGVASNGVAERGVAEDGGIGDGVAEEIVNEEEVGYDSHDSSVYEDDCPAIVEDSNGYREVEQCLAENSEEEEDELIDVEICNNLEDHVCEDDVGNKSVKVEMMFGTTRRFRIHYQMMMINMNLRGYSLMENVLKAVVELEDIDNWMWSVQLLKKDMSFEDGADITM
ncbi:uncharacterized protein LOC110227492 [Arabidopsis lyrata subsp. lyrata]|uniref:uncharacterized protein LOC110227492 n=1 Tax=Arabidopsis lyrata subsp. lyrata TaxID=81972 RepID=UPI000A29E2F9|nr:uncharacterized protein LOC110227492 [Arabidopsis lyrata subsp. lyrata]XP_020877516.1 uncharacterized protein LOC110227492 [Arabidopsis lyrata subsp. lyrata]|eukprot:XP_020877515.1 uncharacterized protein LOC110227492 [Arabidopsis lyrata subsp. lyrata]